MSAATKKVCFYLGCAVFVLSLMFGLTAILQWISIIDGAYDPVADDFMTPAEAQALEMRLPWIGGGCMLVALLTAAWVWRLSRPR